MHRPPLLALLAVTPFAPTASAAPSFVAERAVIVGRVDGGAWSDAATEARADQQAELAVVVVGRRGKQAIRRAPTRAAPTASSTGSTS